MVSALTNLVYFVFSKFLRGEYKVFSFCFVKASADTPKTNGETEILPYHTPCTIIMLRITQINKIPHYNIAHNTLELQLLFIINITI